MKTTLLLASVAALLSLVSPCQATSACAKSKTRRIQEIHPVRTAPDKEHQGGAARTDADELLFRSHTEREMTNPG